MRFDEKLSVLLLTGPCDSDRELARLLYLTLEETGAEVYMADAPELDADEGSTESRQNLLAADGSAPSDHGVLIIAIRHDCDEETAVWLFKNGVRILCSYDFEGKLPEDMVLFLRPFSLELLLAHIKRRGTEGALLTDDPDDHEKGGEKPHFALTDGNLLFGTHTKIQLTDAEEKLLARLIAERGYPVSREVLFNEIKGPHAETPRMVDAYIKRLRQKMAEVTDRRLIYTVRGQGYRLAEEKSNV